MVKNIMIVGVGGQGTLLTSRILGNLILNEGLDVKLSEVHGMAQRGGSVTTFVRYGEKVYEPIIEEGDADILISFEILEAQRYQHFLKEDGVMIVNNQKIDPIGVITRKEEYPKDAISELKDKHRVIEVDSLNEALKLGNPRVFNTIILGVISNYLEFELENWEETIRNMVPEKTIDLNLEAFYVGRSIQKEE